jgi:tRNA-specific 2-thiouridylase
MKTQLTGTKEKNAKQTRVLVAMSGGVDSSVTALLLLNDGFEVIGATLKLFTEHDTGLLSPRECCSLASIQRAQEVCRRLGIPHRVFNYVECFRKQIIEPFCTEYASGRTPNPCISCNRHIKWGKLLEDALAMDCQCIATGHYARINPQNGHRLLLRGLDSSKDQSYALYMLSQNHLAYTVLPLGEYTKGCVRVLARKHQLPTFQTPESQDICFLPNHEDYRVFLSKRLAMHPGEIVDTSGRILGVHKGLPFYTVGQRKGLGIQCASPLYVIEKDLKHNRLIVGSRMDLARLQFSVRSVNWVSIPPPTAGTRLAAEVCVRYRSRPIQAELHVEEDKRVSILLELHDQAIAPGQSAVWYRDDVLLGGGIIE